MISKEQKQVGFVLRIYMPHWLLGMNSLMHILIKGAYVYWIALPIYVNYKGIFQLLSYLYYNKKLKARK